MAISQTKYIDISSQIANSRIGNRDLSGLVFTKSDMLSTASLSAKEKYGDNMEAVALSLNEVLNCFGATSAEYGFAKKYFSYVSPGGRSPRVINFAKVGPSETADAAFTRVSAKSDNFGSFTFLGTFEFDDVAEALEVSSGKSNKFLGVYGEKVVYDQENKGYVYTNAIAHAESLEGVAGAHFVIGADDYCAAMPMAILASINYDNGVNSTVNFMFRTFGGETPVVDTDTDYDTLTEKNINFYGKTQANGKEISFYQRGFNLDGADVAVYCNEMWLKSAIAESFLNLVTSVGRISANYAGASLIRNAIMKDVNQGVRNGTILPLKDLDEEQMALVYQFTNDDLAWSDVQSSGFWLDIVIEREGNTYKAVYRLVYSKGDSIRFMDGSHYLV